MRTLAGICDRESSSIGLKIIGVLVMAIAIISITSLSLGVDDLNGCTCNYECAKGLVDRCDNINEIECVIKNESIIPEGISKNRNDKFLDFYCEKHSFGKSVTENVDINKIEYYIGRNTEKKCIASERISKVSKSTSATIYLVYNQLPDCTMHCPEDNLSKTCGVARAMLEQGEAMKIHNGDYENATMIQGAGQKWRGERESMASEYQANKQKSQE